MYKIFVNFGIYFVLCAEWVINYAIQDMFLDEIFGEFLDI